MPRTHQTRSTGPLFNLSLGTKGVLVVAIPVGALLLAMFVFYQYQEQLRQAQAAVDRTFQVRSDIRRVLIGMVDAETGIRGYLLTKQTGFLQPYEAARRELPNALRDLHRTVSPEEAPRLESLEASVNRILASLDRSRQDAAVKQDAAAVAELEAGKAAMDDLRAQLAAMEDREQRLLARRTTEVRGAVDRLRSAIFAGGLFGLLGGIVAALIFTTHIAGRVQRLEGEARDVAAGRTISHPVSGRDELARLERTLQETSALLANQTGQLHAVQDELESRVERRTSQLRSANEELRQANEMREAVIQSSPLAIWTLDLDGNVTFWNPAAETIFGWKAAEVLGKPLPVIPEDLQEDFRQWLEGFRRGEALSGVERKRQRKDGSPIDVVIWTAPLRDSAGRIRGTIAIDSDISQRKLLEEQFRQSQKLEAVGRLAGGVAHDFNNLLTLIQGYTEMLRSEVESSPDLVDYTQEIQYAAARAAALTSQLLAFSRRQISQPKILNLNEVVEHTMKLLRRIIGEDVEIAARLEPELGKVKIDPVHIDQVIMNLVVNARDAMTHGGRLIIQTSKVRLDDEYVGGHIGVKPGPYCLLAVSDNGTGMTVETRSRLFEPFFTTKEAGKGTGLGLAIVYGIVKQSGGEIMVYSELGHGTTFKIYLPMAEAPASYPAEEKLGELRGSETILLCEDDLKIRRLVTTMLTRQGYRILVAETPDQALEIVRDASDPIDLLLTDVVMPRITGFELAKAVDELRPGTRVLYMSGYTDNQMGNGWILNPEINFIQKPFTSAALAAQVRMALGNEKTAG